MDYRVLLVEDDRVIAGVIENELKKWGLSPKAVSDFLSGKEKALKSLLGQIMKATKGRADARKAEAMLREALTKK